MSRADTRANGVSIWQNLKAWGGFLSRVSNLQQAQLVAAAWLRRQRRLAPARVWSPVSAIRGFLSPVEVGLLYDVACHWPVAGPVIELGSYAGRSTVTFALGGREVHAIDAWSLDTIDGPSYRAIGDVSMSAVHAQFRANVKRAGVTAKIHEHRGLTHTVIQEWRIPAAILFVDAGHSYPEVKADLRLWAPFVLPGGLLIMHDVLVHDYPGVFRAASDLLSQGWQVAASAGSLVAFVHRPVTQFA